MVSLYILIPSLLVLGLVTGFIGTNTGGSALITVPIMLLFGLPPQAAIASGRIASIGTMTAGLWHFHKHGKVDYKIAFPAALFGIAGAAIGALWMISISAITLERIIGILTLVLFAIAIISKKKRKINIQATSPSRLRKFTGYLLLFFAGMLGGFFGGSAIIATYVFLICFHKTMSESVGTRKVSGLAIVVTAVFIYGWQGSINWYSALPLITGTLIGSSLGSAYGLKKGDQWLDRVFTIMVVLLSLRLILAS